jgi:hydroxypyruvate reductase
VTVRANPRELLLGAYHAALTAVDARLAVRRVLSAEPPAGPVRLVAVGKAAASMSTGALEVLGDAVVAGLVVHPEGVTAPSDHRVRSMPSAHPVPDARSLEAGEALLGFVADAPADAHFLFLLSGGASSLVESLVQGGTLDGLAGMNRRLLADGLSIDRMNRVRRAVSRIKGGRLGQCLRGRPARVLLISDVPGDDPAVIGSGLLVPPSDAPSRPSDLPPAYTDFLPPAEPGPSRDDPALAGVAWSVIASNETALNGACNYLRNAGQRVALADAFLADDAVVEGGRVAAVLTAAPSGALVWGGEPSVTLPEAAGEGGRMQALALSAARHLDGNPEVTLLAAGTDGIDGDSQAAGALVDGATLARGRARAMTADAALAAADAGAFLRATGDQLVTGPTGTNVMDVVIGLRQNEN